MSILWSTRILSFRTLPKIGPVMDNGQIEHSHDFRLPRLCCVVVSIRMQFQIDVFGVLAGLGDLLEA